MSNFFVTRNWVVDRLEKQDAPGGNQFVTKAECLEMGANWELLARYQDHQYPVDDDVQPEVYTWSFRIFMGEEGAPMNLGEVFGGEIMYYYVMV